ncbi:MAG: DUF72 domain-containing protein [Firmicutes bacterium]|nr:DUF72 domain-containing protein [Bacillota bacterium]
MIRVGTSGFHYADWYGVFYPPGLDRQEMLSFYARHFDLVELDFTFYQMPVARTLAAMAARTPSGFLFSLKLHRELTHRHDLTGSELDRLAGEFREALTPLREAGKLACILAQFPWSFRPSPESTEFLAVLREALAGLPLVIEFRAAEWVREETFSFLRHFDLGFCAVDEPRLPGLFPPIVRATTELGYVRFHGRNAAKWWQHTKSGERYDYLYSDAELAEWVPRLRELERQTSSTLVLMNNCHAGHAVRNALRLRAMLAENP